MKKIFSGKNTTLIVSLLGLFLLSTGVSWGAFTFLNTDPGNSDNTSRSVSGSRKKIDDGLPKTESCPISGKMFAKPVREIWEKRRPMTVIVENHLEARPLSGISKADVVYEAVAEGGITRFLGVFYCDASVEDFEIAVIRSARVYYINWASEYGDKPLFLHWGGANNIDNNSPNGLKERGKTDPTVDAFKLLSQMGWRNGQYGNDLDGQTNFGYPALVRNYNRLSTTERAKDEHSPVAYVDKVYEQAEKRGFGYKDNDGKAWDSNFVKWSFADDAPLSEPRATEISFEFWPQKPDYDVTWKYNKATNDYSRYNGGQAFVDFYFDKAGIKSKNVVVQFVKEKAEVDKEGHNFYVVTGKGKALIFQNGDAIEATWEKKTQFDRTKFYAKNGKEIAFVKGQIFIEAIPDDNEVKY